MPPRPVIKARQGRPVSAIYIGKAASPNLQDLTQSPHFSSTYPSLIDGTPPGLPDLPEPPSPSSSIGSIKSGLPSPPATNSTGSGSTGDPATVRERPLSLHSNNSASTSSSSHYTTATPMNRSAHGSDSRSSSRLGNARMDEAGAEADFDDDYDKENDNDNESNQDEDDTARFDRRLLSNSNFDNDNHKSSSENVLALQRVRSLAQRNRLALDKLSRLGSPSPARSNTPAHSSTPNSRSPAPSHYSRLSQPPRQLRALPDAPQDLGRSGSETERESVSHHDSTTSRSSHSSSSHSQTYSMSSPRHQSSTISSSHRSTTPPPSHNSPYSRLRHLSAPESPQKDRGVATMPTSVSSGSNSNSNSSHSPSRRRRHRSSMASMSQLQLTDFEEEDDVDDPDIKTATGTRGVTRDRTLNERDLITQSALAAVASSRRSPLDNRRRGALPKEFRSDLVEESPRPASDGMRTSSGIYGVRNGLDEDEKRYSWKQREEPVTPSRPGTNGVGRSSTLRDARRTGGPSPRWSSDDFRAPATLRDRRYGPTIVSSEDLNAQKEGRRQSLRGGSAESALGVWSPGGRLLGEGLRAAGLSPRGKTGDAGPSLASRDTFRERDRRVDWSPQDIEGRRRIDNADRQPTRASTSMAHYQYLDRDEPDTQGGRGREINHNLRGHKSSYSLAPMTGRDESLTRRTRDPLLGRKERDSLPPERAASSMSHYNTHIAPVHTYTSSPVPSTPAHLHERHTTASPFGTRRYTQPPTSMSGSQSQSEHTRLMLESLTMFETQLAKLPPSLGSSTSSSTGASHFQTELVRNAQGVVYSAERLAGLLKHSGARAMEAQVEAEVDSTSERSQDIVDIWGRVAADYRDGGRTADELVRGLTAMLLGVGRIIRDLGGSAASDFGSPSVPGRNASLTEDDLVTSPEVRSGTSGRDSRASRQSWEPTPRDRDREREDALRRLDGGPRPDSVLARASPATFQKLRDREREQLETPPPASQSNRKATASTSERLGMSGTFRRLFTPREQREQILDRDAKAARDSGGARSNITTLDSQETVHQRFEPSPTPGGKARLVASPSDRKRTLTPLSIPKPLPVLPSESAVRRPLNSSTDSSGAERANSLRRSVRRASTTRGERPSFPSITSPSNATTALTPHTVSNTPSSAAIFPLSRTESGKSTRSQVTFSRPNVPSVSATLSDLQQQHLDSERKRTVSTTSSNAEPSTSVLPDSLMRSISGSETERDARRRTLGVKTARASLDKQHEIDEHGVLTASGTRISSSVTVHAADRSAATTILHQSAGAKRERRRTVTDIWPRE